jgi:hypothetical protein
MADGAEVAKDSRSCMPREREQGVAGGVGSRLGGRPRRHPPSSSSLL